MLYGALPRDLGLIDLSPTEMMFWMYCPISLPGRYSYALPDNLVGFQDIVDRVRDWEDMHHPDGRWVDSYVYLTAKTLWVSDEYIGNRPGWHCDGFGTADLNYIWSDRAPTEFLSAPKGLTLSTDCDVSMEQMREYALVPAFYDAEIITYPDKHLLKLDQRVIHRSPVRFREGMRTFVKVSISEERYDLVGNSRNYDLPASHWPLVERREERNHPASVQA